MQGPVLTEVLVVDGGSTDGTTDIVDAEASVDRRIRWMSEPPRPTGSVGRPWAIAAGCEVARGEWILIVDADVAPQPGMVAGAVSAAQALSLDAVSFAPRIIAPGAGARWLQPAFLTTLVYRFGPAGVDTAPDRVMANGQCLLIRRATLERLGGYRVATESYCDDIRFARHLAANGARVAFLEGPRLFDVVMYRTGRETWHAWPRSLNMRDATPPRWRWLDAVFLVLAQALPLPALILLTFGGHGSGIPAWLLGIAIAVNTMLLVVRLLIGLATAPSFARRGAAYWLAPIADPIVVLRVVETMFRHQREWRGEPRLVR